MKKITAIGVLLCALHMNAATFYDQLCAFNFNWKKYYMRAPQGGAQNFSCDRELIQAHLGAVIGILKSNPTDQLTAKQLDSRVHMISLLEGYRAAGNFPMNYYRAERIPVFIDEHGTHCAVGYLMMMTGYDEMAQRISHADNYVWVKDLNDPGVPQWQQASGLTFEELALIQGAYDIYPPNSYYLENRYETPQQPKCTTAYFGGLKKNVWCKGEGSNGVLNGKWIQNYSAGMPWIEGYYSNGKRCGQWKEYFQGTTLLCRTERWDNDKLNGTRTRFDESGNVIEEIIFEEGVAVSKINYSLYDSVAYVRIPQDSNRVLTQVFNAKGKLIACGHETIHNPDNLMWYQNIQLTALNFAQVSARNAQQDNNLNAQGGIYHTNLYNQPQLVEYQKEDDWVYFPDTAQGYAQLLRLGYDTRTILPYQYKQFGAELLEGIAIFDLSAQSGFDSIHVEYDANRVVNFYGYSAINYTHLYMEYYTWNAPQLTFNQFGVLNFEDKEQTAIKLTGQYNSRDQRIGTWNYYTQQGAMYKTEEYLIPVNEDEDERSARR